MGQYQQWLHYQQTDKQLRSQLEAIEAELAQIQDRLHLLEQGQQEQLRPLDDNPIIQALAATLYNNNTPPKSTTQHTNASMTSSSFNSQSSQPSQLGESISPALLSWGGLPDFGPQEIGETASGVEHTLSPALHPEIELLPEDMTAFFDAYTQTDPQLELPWWLRNITISTNDMQGNRPIDQQSIRTNRLVKRWIERWGRQSSPSVAEKEQEGARE
jgi:hypothetical protein